MMRLCKKNMKFSTIIFFIVFVIVLIEAACNKGQTLCNKSCKNLNTDCNNCGTCGNKCPKETHCKLGKCICEHSSDTICNNHCKNLKKDRNNCGICGNKCPSGSKCISGICVCKDVKGVKQALCNGKCVPACLTGEHFNANCECCLDVCSQLGAPMWSNTIQPGGNGVITSDTTAQSCCLSCYNDPACAQWAFQTVCSHNVGTTCVNPLIPYVEGGGRCESQLNNCFPTPNAPINKIAAPAAKKLPTLIFPNVK